MIGYFDHKFYNTYYYANIISNILSKDIALIGFISYFFDDENIIYDLAKPFEKRSAFHSFIEYMIGLFFEEDMNDHDQKEFDYHKQNNYPLGLLYAEHAFKEYNLDYSFKDFLNDKQDIEYRDIENYHEDLMLSGTLEELYSRIADEVFFLMFNNREALLQFNYIVGEHMSVNVNDIEEDAIRCLFKLNGTLRRVTIPEWVKRAVFFRDRGRCCLCQKDLSGILNIHSQKNFDHIIPLAQNGLNDISNLQLLCDVCNKKKSSGTIATSTLYESWY